jgi:hypothetical protein
MTIKVITGEELNHLYRTLDAVLEEFEAIDETTSHVFTTGAREMVEESIEMIGALQDYEEPSTEDIPIDLTEGDGC